jgi:hypothetical protein
MATVTATLLDPDCGEIDIQLIVNHHKSVWFYVVEGHRGLDRSPTFVHVRQRGAQHNRLPITGKPKVGFGGFSEHPLVTRQFHTGVRCNVVNEYPADVVSGGRVRRARIP